MKRKKLTAITLALAAAAASSILGGSLLSDSVKASAEPYTLALGSVFSATDKESLVSEEVTVNGATEQVAAFALGDGEKAWLKRNLALAWYEGGEAQNFNVSFAFKALNFKTVTINMDSPSAWATDEEKTTNKVVFTNDNGALSVAVNGGTSHSVTYTAGETLTLTLTENGNYGELTAKLSDAEIGTFENVGAKYASYSLNKTHPLEFVADFGETAEITGKEETRILLHSLNGQDFYLNEDSEIEDTVAPALVVNEDIEAFLLGSAFSLDYKVIDVLQDTNLPTVQIEYYQYNPTNTVEAGEDEFAKYKKSATATAFTSNNFFQTVYTPEGKTEPTTVFDTVKKATGEGEEYVAIRFLVGDSTHTATEGDNAKASYDLAWYLSGAKKVQGITGLRDSELLYVPINKNNEGPTYKILDTTAGKNDKTADYADVVAWVNEKLEEEAANVYAGSNSYINLPSFEKLFADNNSYGSLKFTISYQTEYSSSPSTTSVTPGLARIPVSKEGVYEFKIFASDSAGNKMKYYYEGELVEVSTSNIWKIEEIPYFTFTIANRGLKMATSYTSSSSRKATKIKDTSYTFEDLKVVGATDLKEAYALYKVNSFADYNATVEEKNQIRKSDLSAITYEAIAENLTATKLATVTDGNYFKLYLETYATMLANHRGNANPTEAQLQSIIDAFERIGEAGDRVNSEEKYEVYEWSASSQSFKTAEEGDFVVLADYWEGKATSYRAMAYKVITVESETATIKGESDWLKNNTTSVILFSIAGFLLIVIVILFMVKPSDETLEDLDTSDVAKKAAAKKARILGQKEEGKKKKFKLFSKKNKKDKKSK